jgi:hypothetical protein
MTYSATAAWIRERQWFGWAVGVVVWIAWGVSLAIGMTKTGRIVDAEGTVIGVDHMAFYSAARLVRDHQSAKMYDYDFLGTYQGTLLGWDWETLEAYRNPPFYALLYLPTAGLSFLASFLIWTAVGFGLLVLSILWLRPANPTRAVLWALTFYPVFAAVSFGQNTLLSLAVFAAVYRLMEERRPFAAGLVAGLLWFKPQLLIGLFVWWACAPWRFRWCWVGVVVAGAVLAAVSWLAVPEASEAFVRTLRTNVGFGGFNEWNIHNPKAFFKLLWNEPLFYWPLAVLCSLAGIAVVWWLARRTGAPVAVMFPAAVFLSLWASPHALIYEWALLVPAAVVLWERFPERRNAWLCLFALAWAVLAFSTVLAKVQIDAKLSVVVQASIPVLGVVGWLAARELAATGRPVVDAS